jgi:hypothetical protein
LKPESNKTGFGFDHFKGMITGNFYVHVSFNVEITIDWRNDFSKELIKISGGYDYEGID